MKEKTINQLDDETAEYWRGCIKLLQESLYGKELRENTLVTKLDKSASTIRRYRSTGVYSPEQYRTFMDEMAKAEGKKIEYTPDKTPELIMQKGQHQIKLVDLIRSTPTSKADPVRMFADLSKAFRRDGGRYHGDYLLVGQKTTDSTRADWGRRIEHEKSVFYVWPVQIRENGLVVMRTEHEKYHNNGVLYYDDQCLSFLFLTFGVESDPDSLSPRLGNVIFRVGDRGFRSDLFDAEIGVSAKRSSSRAAKAEECILIKIDDFFDRYPTSFTVEYTGSDASIKCDNKGKGHKNKWSEFVTEIYQAKNGFLKSAFEYLHEIPRHIRIDEDAVVKLKGILADNNKEDGGLS